MLQTKRSNGLLCSEGWLEFNRIKWKLTPVPVRVGGTDADTPSAETVFYLDKRGKIRMPRLNPYMPMRFTPSATRDESVLSQWMTVSEQIAREFEARGLAGQIPLPPEVDDVRSWMWRDFLVGLRYTFYLQFPYPPTAMDRGPRGKINIALKNGFSCDIAAPPGDVLECLRATETRQGFSYGLTKDDLLLAQELMGWERFRCYVSYAPTGEPASTSIILHSPGEVGAAWVEGTKNEFLTVGSHQLLRSFIIEDLTKAQAAGLDFMGANIPSISYEKKDWGPQLVPYYVIAYPGMKNLVRHAREWLKFRQDGKQERHGTVAH